MLKLTKNVFSGTPSSFYSMCEILEKVEYEANVYRNHGVNGIILENMHDTPYSRGQDLGEPAFI